MIALGDNYYDCLVLCSRTFLIRLTRFLPPSASSIFLPSYSTVTYSGPSSLALAITFSCSHFPSWSSRGMAMLIEFWWRVTEQGTALGGAVLTENQSSAMRLMEDGIKEKKPTGKPVIIHIVIFVSTRLPAPVLVHVLVCCQSFRLKNTRKHLIQDELLSQGLRRFCQLGAFYKDFPQ